MTTTQYTALEMELAVVNNILNKRKQVIVPNVWWGMHCIGLEHECDLLVMSGSGYLTEIEIKVSLSDLKRDKQKRHSHYNAVIKQLYFAIPRYLSDNIDLIPEQAGVFIVNRSYRDRTQDWIWSVTRERSAPARKTARPLKPEEQYKLARLGALRIWDLKKKYYKTLTAKG